MVKQSLFIILAISSLSIFFLPLTCEMGDCQEIIQDEVYHNELGLNYFIQGYYKLKPQGKVEEADELIEQAITAFKQAIALNETYVDAHRNLAKVYYLQKRLPEAEEEYKRLVDLTLYDIDACVRLASAYAMQDKYLEAIDILEKAKKITNDTRVVNQLDGFIQKLQIDE